MRYALVDATAGVYLLLRCILLLTIFTEDKIDIFQVYLHLYSRNVTFYRIIYRVIFSVPVQRLTIHKDFDNNRFWGVFFSKHYHRTAVRSFCIQYFQNTYRLLIFKPDYSSSCNRYEIYYSSLCRKSKCLYSINK